MEMMPDFGHYISLHKSCIKIPHLYKPGKKPSGRKTLAAVRSDAKDMEIEMETGSRV